MTTFLSQTRRFLARHAVARLAVTLGCAVSLLAQQPTLRDVKNVYLLPMPSGLDQYLALRLTETSTLQVVTDPQKADVVFTDRIGGDFEDTLKELFRPKDAKPETFKAGENVFQNQHMRPLSRGHGTVFLVERGSGNVLWSTSEQPKSAQVSDMKKSAERIVDRLAEAQGKARKEK